MKAYTGRRGTAVFILNFSTTQRLSGQFHGSATLPLKKGPSLFTEQNANVKGFYLCFFISQKKVWV